MLNLHFRYIFLQLFNILPNLDLLQLFLFGRLIYFYHFLIKLFHNILLWLQNALGIKILFFSFCKLFVDGLILFLPSIVEIQVFFVFICWRETAHLFFDCISSIFQAIAILLKRLCFLGQFANSLDIYDVTKLPYIPEFCVSLCYLSH